MRDGFESRVEAIAVDQIAPFSSVVACRKEPLLDQICIEGRWVLYVLKKEKKPKMETLSNSKWQ